MPHLTSINHGRGGKPSLIIGIQRRKASIRTSITARFPTHNHRFEGRHAFAPVGGCSRPHDHRRTARRSESPRTTAAPPLAAQNPPPPPPQPSTDTTKPAPVQRPLPRPQQPPPQNVTVTT